MLLLMLHSLTKRTEKDTAGQVYTQLKGEKREMKYYIGKKVGEWTIIRRGRES